MEWATVHRPPATKEIEPALRLGFGSNELENAPHRRVQANANPLRIYRGPEAALRTRRASSDQLASVGRQHRVILDATDEAVARIGKRQSKIELSLEDFFLESSTTKAKKTKMVTFTTDAIATATGPDLKSTADSLFESLGWLDEGDDLDLKLALNDYNITPKGATSPRSWRSGSMRRHLSISKLPFINTTATTVSRPGTKDATSSPSPMGSPAGSAPGSPGHVRRRSRALSLITSTKQTVPDAATFADPGAAHYQDPDARMKLRVYLGSPHKFDEAVEFGFPSIDKVQQGGEAKLRERSASQHEKRSKGFARLSTFAEDDVSSQYTSDQASTQEPESPRTPEATERTMTLGVSGDDQELVAPKTGYAQAPAASREMTLRMTLTRPDLRANEAQIYGWQKDSSRRQPQEAVESPQKQPSSPSREGFSKENIERQFAAMDQEDLANESGGFKRLWNRMRRS